MRNAAARIVPAALALLLAGPVAAESWFKDSYYVGVGVKGGLALLDDASNDGEAITFDSEYDAGLGVSGTFGYSFTRSLRAEAEVAGRVNDADSFDFERDQLTAASFSGETEAEGDVQSIAFMLNGYYDLDTGSRWMPYVGVGVGAAYVEAELATGGQGIVDDDDVVFAYQAMIGVAYQTTAFSAIGLGYRYFATDDPDLEAPNGTTFSSEYSSHNIELELRLKF